MAQEPATTALTKVDPHTGKSVTIAPPMSELRPPDEKLIRDISKVAGANPAVLNLRDHPEFAGCALITTNDPNAIAFTDSDQDGKRSSYLIVTCWIVAPGQKPEPGKAVLLRTGASNVYNRIAEAWIKGQLPVKGTLRKGGRAWFLD